MEGPPVQIQPSSSLTNRVQNPDDHSKEKRSLKYWIDLAKTLDRGGINALFLADTYGGYDTYEGSLDNCIRRAAQWPVTDPTIVSALLQWNSKSSDAANERFSLLVLWRQSRRI